MIVREKVTIGIKVASKKPETLFGEKLDKWLKETYGDECWNENIQQVSIRGTPDRLICIRGDFIAVELKKDEKAAIAQLQTYKLDKIQKAGGRSYIISPESFDYFKQEIKFHYPV